MILEIAGKSISNVCLPPRIDKTHRSQAVNVALDGYTLIDRIGGHKYVIIVEIPFIKDAFWHSIVTDLEQKQFNVRFTYGSLTLTRNFYLDGDIPAPVLFSKNGKSYYSGILLRMGEI
jgi:hypothetical protein